MRPEFVGSQFAPGAAPFLPISPSPCGVRARLVQRTGARALRGQARSEQHDGGRDDFRARAGSDQTV